MLMTERNAVFTFASAAPLGLPAGVFPQSLGAVRAGIEDLTLDYDAHAQELHLALTLSKGATPAREVIGVTYRDLVLALVDHVSFELGFPADPPTQHVSGL